jgi:hypothetical protein
MFGAAAKYVSNMTNKSFSLAEFAASMITAAFLSLMVGLLCSIMEWGLYWGCFLSGMACWAGFKLVDAVFESFKTKATKKLDDELDKLG